MAPNPEFVKKNRTAKAAKPGGKSALGTATAEKKPKKARRLTGGEALMKAREIVSPLGAVEPWPIGKNGKPPKIIRTKSNLAVLKLMQLGLTLGEDVKPWPINK